MILVAYRHGLRASEVCDLRWQQIDISEGRLHVHRVKNGIPSVHPIRGDEIRALRKLRRDYPRDAYVFVYAGGQSAPSVSTASSSASERLPRCHSRSIPTCFGMLAGSSSPTTATTRGPCSTTSGTRTSSKRSDTPKWRPTGSRTFGEADPRPWASWCRRFRAPASSGRLPIAPLSPWDLPLRRAWLSTP